MTTRREWLLASGAFAAALTMGPRSSFAQATRTVKVGVGLKSLNSSVINLLIGEALGYNAEEGFKVQGLALGGNANVQVATDKGDVDVGIGVPSYALPILARNEWGNAQWFYQYTYPYKWDIAVKPGSTAKASRFILENPAAGAKAFLKLYPETAPRGSSEEQAVKSVLEAISRRIKLYEPPYQGAKMGSIRVDEFVTEAKMNDWAIADFSKVYTNDLIDKINDFDVEKIKAQARSFTG
jgi:hypothetical protein